jgi:hypothetical protein
VCPRDASTSFVVEWVIALFEQDDHCLVGRHASAPRYPPRNLLGLASDSGLLDSVRDEAAHRITAHSSPLQRLS